MKLNYPKTIKVGLAFAIIMVFWSAYDFVVPLLLDNTYGLSDSLRGLVMGLDNLLSLFLLPIFGKISDKSNSKWGRRTPFIVIGTIAAVVLMIFVPISSNKQLEKGIALREEIEQIKVDENFSYTDHKGVVYDREGLYTMLYEEGKSNSNYCDHEYLKKNGIDTLQEYLEVAKKPFTTNDDGEQVVNEDYKNLVQVGIDTYSKAQINEKFTKADPTSLIIYMIILFFVLVAMATFRSPAVALMPDVTPKPLRSQANAMINLVGGAGGAIAFLIYTITFMINPYGYMAVFIAVACSMIILLGLFLWLVKEKKLVKECEELCLEYGISNDEEEEPATQEKEAETLDKPKISDKERMVSFILILASIFMWFMGYNAVSSNLSIYLTKTLLVSSGLSGIISGISMGISAIAFIPVGMLAVKIGRRKSIMLGFALAVISFILVFFFVANPSSAAMYLFTIFYLIAGFGLIIANVNTFPMVVELSSSDTVGKYTGLYYTATMSAQAITPFVAGLVMENVGYKYLFLYATICVVLAIVLMFFVKHGDSKAPPKSKLEMLADGD